LLSFRYYSELLSKVLLLRPSARSLSRTLSSE
jgi:hypothetical protein